MDENTRRIGSGEGGERRESESTTSRRCDQDKSSRIWDPQLSWVWILIQSKTGVEGLRTFSQRGKPDPEALKSRKCQRIVLQEEEVQAAKRCDDKSCNLDKTRRKVEIQLSLDTHPVNNWRGGP